MLAGGVAGVPCQTLSSNSLDTSPEHTYNNNKRLVQIAFIKLILLNT